MPHPATPLPADVQAALERGDRVQAIIALRAATGLGLQEAKDAIDARAQGRPLASTFPAPAHALPDAVLQAVRQGHKIEAIRVLRETTGLGLKEAKEAVDAVAQSHGPVGDRLSPGEVRRGGNLAWWAAAAAVGAAAAYYLLRTAT